MVDDHWEIDRREFAGAAACRSCHAPIVENQLASNHARTIRDLSREPPRAPFNGGAPVTDPLTGVSYSMRKDGTRYEIAVSRGGATASQPLSLEFGSGSLAHGYVARIDDNQWVDARLNYYTGIQGWDFTSGQDRPAAHLLSQPLGRPLNNLDVARCFFCHSTAVRAQGVKGGVLDERRLRVAADRSILNVTCESCHGPRAEHVRARRAGRVDAAAPITADAMNQMCGTCHGLKGVNPDHPVITRFEPWGLSQSRCFQKSAGRLSCATCHDPHGNAVRDVRFYELKCLGCHTAGQQPVAQKVCPVNAKTGCIRCHMPADSRSMLHTTFTDHRIRVARQSADAR